MGTYADNQLTRAVPTSAALSVPSIYQWLSELCVCVPTHISENAISHPQDMVWRILHTLSVAAEETELKRVS